MRNDPKHIVLASAVLLASWLVSSATSRPQSPPAAGATRAARPSSRDVAVDSLAQEVSREAVRLHERLGDAPAPRRTPRDPFRFATRALPAAPRTVVAGVAVPAPADAAATATAPGAPFKLIGIAETRTDGDGVERRAILSGPNELLIVGKDDAVGTRYLVVAVGADAVELFDASSNQPLRLTLR